MPEPYTHAVDTDTMCGVYSADTMNQIPMPMIPMPCVVSSILMELIPMQPMLMPFPCPVVTVTDAH